MLSPPVDPGAQVSLAASEPASKEGCDDADEEVARVPRVRPDPEKPTSRERLEHNIAHCPYGIFVAEREGRVMVGYRNYPKGPMQKVQALLDEIAREAVDN